jgi:hypothetical protein
LLFFSEERGDAPQLAFAQLAQSGVLPRIQFVVLEAMI